MNEDQIQMMIDKILGYLDIHDPYQATAFRNNLEYMKTQPDYDFNWWLERNYNRIFNITD